tara:strand:- start:213 stop:416 length:204 start_codon:yes stop_codon:yes gene_type:complete
MTVYVQQVTYKKLPTGRKEYTKTVTAATPNAAKVLIQNEIGSEIAIVKCLTTVPSTATGASNPATSG